MHLWKFLWHTNVFPVATWRTGGKSEGKRPFSSLSVDPMSFFLHCNQKQRSNCADLWGNFKSRFWTLCNLGLFNGSLNIGKNYQIGVRLGLKRDFFPPYFVLVQFQSDWDIIWRVSGFFSSLYSHWLALWDKESTTLRERKREFLLPLASDQIQVGTIPLEKKKSTIFTRDCYHRCYLFIHVSSVFQVPPSQIRLFYTMFHCNPQIMSGWYSVNTARKYVYFKTWRQFCINVFRKKMDRLNWKWYVCKSVPKKENLTIVIIET